MGTCKKCDSPLATDQRYCVACGDRRQSMPSRLARLSAALDMPAPPALAGVPAFAFAPPVAVQSGAVATAFDSLIARGAPSPRALAVAVFALLGFGVLIGSVFGTTSGPVWVMPTSAPLAQATPAGKAAEAAPAAAEAAPAAVAAPIAGEPLAPTGPTAAPPAAVKHVWLIVLSGQSYAQSFADFESQSYLVGTLASQGVVFENYSAVAEGELANTVALVSGQRPTPQLSANCPIYDAVSPAEPDPANFGLVSGEGCVYPDSVRSIGDALTAAGKSWSVYAESVNDPAAGRSSACEVPAAGAADSFHAASRERPFTTWSNPFFYFSSFSGSPNCEFSLFGLDRLKQDLKEAKSPAFSAVIPNRCHSGSNTPCGEGEPSGLASSDDFLRDVVGQITGSKDYADGGVIAITFDQGAPTAGGATTALGQSDPTAATGEAEDPQKVGLLLISPTAQAGSRDAEGSYNHYSLLATLADWLEVEKLGLAQDPQVKALPGEALGLR